MGGNLLWHFSGTNNQPLLVQKLIITTVLHDIHACMHACMHTYIHTYTHPHTCTHPHIHTYTHTYVHTYTHILAQNSHCEFWCGMYLTCKNTNSKLTRRMKNNKNTYIYIYIYYIYLFLYLYNTYNHSRRWSYKATAINYMSPPAATYMRPGAGL